MKFILLPFILAMTLAAQTASFPDTTPDNAGLLTGFDRAESTLSSSIDASTLTLNVASGTRFGDNTLVTIGAEQILICTRSGNVLTACVGGRGYASTTAATHASGSTVRAQIGAWYHNRMKAETVAIASSLRGSTAPGQTFTGDEKKRPLWRDSMTLDSRAYEFTRTSGTDITADLSLTGAHTATLTLCPYGVGGANTKHYLYITGGTGTAEAVLITGGTCTSGAASGTLTFTTVNTHTGAWTLTSATAGIQEAAFALPAGSGTVAIAAGSHQLRAAISYKEHQAFRGAGPATRIVPASATATMFTSNLTANSASQEAMTNDNVAFEDMTLDAHTFDGINSVYGIRNTVTPGSTEFASLQGIRIRNVHFNNVYFGVYLDRVHNALLSNVDLYSNARIMIVDSTKDLTYHSYYVQIENLNQHRRCMDSDCTRMSYVSVAAIDIETCVSCRILNTELADMVGGNPGPNGIRLAGGVEDFSFSKVLVQQMAIGLKVESVLYAQGRFWPGHFTLESCGFEQAWDTAIHFEDGIATPPATIASARYSIGNVRLVNTGAGSIRPEAAAYGATLFRLGNYTRDVSITGGAWNNWPSTGTWKAIQGSNSTGLTITGAQFNNLNNGTPSTNTVTGVDLLIADRYTITGNNFNLVSTPISITGGGNSTYQVHSNTPLNVNTSFHLSADGATARLGPMGTAATLTLGQEFYTSGNVIGTPDSAIYAAPATGTLLTPYLGTMQLKGGLLSIDTTAVYLPSSLFAALGTATARSVKYCSNCNVATPCTTGGAGAYAFANGAQWACPF